MEWDQFFVLYASLFVLLVDALTGEVKAQTHGTVTVPTERYFDKNFPASMEVMGRNITCADHVPNKAYVGETWTCKDMRINGRRLGFHHIPGFGANPTCSLAEKLDGHNDLKALCEELLKTQTVETDGDLTVLISEANCVKNNEHRVIFNFNTTDEVHQWVDLNKEPGYVISLHCMIIP